MRWAIAVMVLGACGDSLPAPDAAVATDAPVGLVRVRFGGPDTSAVRVFFQAADSSLVLVTHADAQGSANAFMPAGGYVTLVVTVPGGFRLYTWAGVQPGDDLVLDDGGAIIAGVAPEVLLSLPAVPDATDYELYTRCDGKQVVTGATIAPMATQVRDCGDGTDMMFVADGPARRYLLLRDQHPTPGASISLAGPWRDLESSSVKMSRIPANVGSVRVTRGIVDHGSLLIGLADTNGAMNPDAQRAVTDEEQVMLPREAIMRVDVDGFDQASGAGDRHFHATHWGPPAPSVSLDLGAVHLRPFTSTPQYDPAANMLRWTEGAGDVPDAVLLGWVWNRPTIGANFRWLIAAPRGEEPAIHLPVLPDELTPDISLSGPGLVDLATFSIAGGYDRARSHLVSWDAFSQFPVSGDSGDAITQQLEPLSPD